MMQYSKVAIHRQLKQKASTGKGRLHLFACGWINGHNSAILAPINFYLTPFYLSCAFDSDGI